ncbi:MAG TPA: hypothetical protein VFT22_22270, partial [Kofleriaceae bacterium]|nr:hypothetical protein [Kofleriaceae bacterium]
MSHSRILADLAEHVLAVDKLKRSPSTQLAELKAEPFEFGVGMLRHILDDLRVAQATCIREALGNPIARTRA